MTKYQPIKLAHRVFEAVGGSNKKLQPVIFMHDLLCSKEIWENIPQRVAELTKRKVFTYDARNHGESEHTTNASLLNNLPDLYTFMDQMNVKETILVGHGYGGITAINAALQEPKKVEKAFIVDMHVRKVQEELINRSIIFLNAWAEVVKSLPRSTPEEDVTKISLQMVYERLLKYIKFQSEKESYLLSKIRYNKRPDGRYDMCYNTQRLIFALLEYLDTSVDHSGQYERPSFFIYGSKSPYTVDSEAEHIKKHFPNAEMIGFKGASHNLFVDFPDKFVDTLVQRMAE